MYRLLNLPNHFKSKRRTRVYCVGAAKSGTHSVADLFANHYRSSHEPASKQLIHTILAYEEGRLDDRAVEKYLKKRDRTLELQVDSSQLNMFFVEKLVSLFPDAKFILTIRDPYSWLDSLTNHSQSDAHELAPHWKQIRDFRFRPDLHIHPPEEQALKARDLYTLDGYLSYWTYHNKRVMNAVPARRLMIVKTNEITACAADLLRFAGAPHQADVAGKTHSFMARAKYNTLDELDQNYLQAKMREHCGDLIDRFFPEIREKHSLSL